MTRKKAAIMPVAALAILAGCEKHADGASRNLSMAADNFEITRPIAPQ